MMLSTKDLHHFEVFCQIVESGGITSAVYRTKLSQPSLSAILSKLEKQLAMRLCDRGRSGFQLTPQGEVVYREAKSALASFEAFGDALTEIQGDLIGRVQIGYIDHLLSYQPSPITRALHYSRQHAPNIHFEFHQADIFQLERRLMDGTDQLLIGVLPEQMRPRLRTHPLFTETSHLYVASGITDKQLESLQVFAGGYAAAKTSNSVAGRFALVDISDQLTLDSVLMHALSGNYGVFLPTHFARLYEQQGLIRALEPASYFYHSEVSVAFNPKRRLSQASEFTLQTLLQFAES